MIEVKNLYKSFQENSVLINVNLKIAKNEIVAIQGPSGAGKTTLLNSIGLLDSIDKGEIIFEKKNINLFTNKEKCTFRNKQVGFVFQFHNLLPEFSALENIYIPSLVAGNSLKQAKKSAEYIMKELNIFEKKDVKPNELSGGEQQRIAIGRALINAPKLILADEPTGNLDSKQSMNLFKLFNDISIKFNTTFLIITHDNHLAKMCHRIIKIKDGRIIE